jgi:hypothetical protein
MKMYPNQHSLDPPSFESRHLVMLNEKYIKTRPPARELEHTMYGLYDILDIISPMAIRLDLPTELKIYQR